LTNVFPEKFQEKTELTSIIERIFAAKLRESTIQKTRTKRISRKTKSRTARKSQKNPPKITDTTLAFHHDIRPQIQQKMKE